MSTLFSLEGKNCLVTGASKGMGKAMALALAEHGASVVISSRKQDQLEETANEINKQVEGQNIVPIAANAGRKEDLKQLVQETNKVIGEIDVLIGNAGVNPHYGPMSDISDEAYDKTMATNVKSDHWLCQMVAPDMISRGGGSIMITSSVGAFEPSLHLGTYAISKLAVIGLVRNLAAEYGPKNIRVNAICPAIIKTDFAKALWENPDILNSVLSSTPMRRIGEPDEIAGVAIMLASDAGNYINGQTIVVDGGTTIS